MSGGPHPDLRDFQWILSVDGSSNKQDNGARVILEGPSGLLIEQSLKFAFKASNNQVEYEALIAGMLLSQELGAQNLLVKSDSLKYVMLLKEAFIEFQLVQVPREQNSRADLLAKLTSLGKGNQQRSVIQETLKALRTAEENPPKEVLGVKAQRGSSHRSLTQETLKVPRVVACEMLEGEVMVISQGSMVDTWITPYQHYLANGLRPSEPAEAKAIKINSGKYTLNDGKLFCYVYAHPTLICISGDHCVRVMTELHEGIYKSHIGGRVLALKVI